MSSSLTLPNPFTRERWNLTAQSRFIREHGIEIATLYARAAGVEIGSVRPPPERLTPKNIHHTRIVNKLIPGGGGNRGYSGDGPPGEEV